MRIRVDQQRCGFPDPVHPPGSLQLHLSTGGGRRPTRSRSRLQHIHRNSQSNQQKLFCLIYHTTKPSLIWKPLSEIRMCKSDKEKNVIRHSSALETKKTKLHYAPIKVRNTNFQFWFCWTPIFYVVSWENYVILDHQRDPWSTELLSGVLIWFLEILFPNGSWLDSPFTQALHKSVGQLCSF